MCVDKICASPIVVPLSPRLRFSHDIHKVGTTAQMICSRGSIYHLGKNQHGTDGLPVTKVNLHCTVGTDGVARYVDDFGNSPSPGCSKGIFWSCITSSTRMVSTFVPPWYTTSLYDYKLQVALQTRIVETGKFAIKVLSAPKDLNASKRILRKRTQS